MSTVYTVRLCWDFVLFFYSNILGMNKQTRIPFDQASKAAYDPKFGPLFSTS